MELTDIARKFHATKTEHTFFSSTYGVLSRIDHI